MGLNKDSPGGPKIRYRGVPAGIAGTLFLTTVTHFGHFLGVPVPDRCRRPPGSPRNPPGSPQGLPRDSPGTPQNDPKIIPK